MTDERQTESGTNYIALTTIDNAQKPALEDFVKAEVYVRRADEYRSERPGELKIDRVDQPQIGGFYAMSLDVDPLEIEVIGQLPMDKEYRVHRIVGFGWNVLRSSIPQRADYESKNGKPSSRLFISEWTMKPNRFPFFRLFNR